MKADKLMDAMGMIDDELILEAKHPVSKSKHFSFKRYALFAAVLLLCIALAVPALAATNTGHAYDILYAVSPAIAQSLKPINMSCEYNGIKMEVISADINDDSANIYISMQDLTGNRIDKTIDLFDSYSINKPFSCSSCCQFVDYNDNSKSATFLINITQWDNKKITGDKITFSVLKFLSGKEKFDDLLPQIDLTKISSDPNTQQNVDIRGIGNFDASNPEGPAAFLLSQEELRFSPTPGVEITACGYIDGMLHVQAHYDDILNTDNHGYVYLKNSDGHEIQCLQNIAFWGEDRSGSYEEYIFDISQDELKNYRFYGTFWTCDGATEGNWQVTFPLENK